VSLRLMLGTAMQRVVTRVGLWSHIVNRHECISLRDNLRVR